MNIEEYQGKNSIMSGNLNYVVTLNVTGLGKKKTVMEGVDPRRRG